MFDIYLSMFSFRGSDSWKNCQTWDFWINWAHLGTPALSFNVWRLKVITQVSQVSAEQKSQDDNAGVPRWAQFIQKSHVSQGELFQDNNAGVPRWAQNRSLKVMTQVSPVSSEQKSYEKSKFLGSGDLDNAGVPRWAQWECVRAVPR